MLLLLLVTTCYLVVVADTTECGSSMMEDSGIVTSPSVLGGRPDCNWYISLLYNKRVVLTFNHFHIPGKSATVTIYDGLTKTSPVLFTGSGTLNSYPTYTSSHNQVLITMTSRGYGSNPNTRGSRSRKGFTLSYNADHHSRNSSSQDFYGNQIILQNAFLPTGAQKSYIDYETNLPDGLVTAFHFYIHAISDMPVSYVRVQIWRLKKQFTYQLVWEKRVMVSLGQQVGGKYVVALEASEQARVKYGDRIGWTNEGRFGVISFQYTEGHRTYFRTVTNSDFPLVGQQYTFDNIHLPSIFSIGVEVNHETMCPPPRVPCHGSLDVPDPAVSGTVASFSCDEGYTLVNGNAQQRCLPNGDWEWYPNHGPVCQLSNQVPEKSCSIPDEAVALDRPDLDIDLYRNTKDEVSRASALLALPDGGALVAVMKLPGQRTIYRIDSDGTDVRNMYHCQIGLATCSSVTALLRHKNLVFAAQRSGWITKFLMEPNKLILVHHYNTFTSGQVYGGSLINNHQLLLTDFTKGEVFSFDINDRKKIVEISSLNQPVDVAFAEGNNRDPGDPFYAVCEFGGHQVKLYNYRRTLIRSIGVGKLINPHAVYMIDSLQQILVADTGNHRISSFTEQGDFIRHWVSRENYQLDRPEGMSFCYPYLWVRGRLNVSSGYFYGLRFKIFRD